MRVLHVVEALSGGVASALEDYVCALPEVDHYVLCSRRREWHTGDSLSDRVSAFESMTDGHLARIRQLHAAVDRWKPNLVHAHSSFAGLYARVRRLPEGVPVVYTPHCYATERLDVGFLPRLAFRRAERLLTRRTASVAAVSPREAELAREFNTGQHVVYVPNIASPSGFRYPGRRPGALQVMAIGRLCPQKGPEFFAAAAAASHDPEIEWTWVGDGDASYRTQLEAAGVSVTGWQPRDIALKYLQSADVYVHTAAWEGAPMTVLEAAAFGIPIVGRHVPALERLGIDLLFKTPEDLSDALSNLAMAPSLSDLMRASEELASRHTPAAQRQALLAAYSAALNSDLGEQFSRFSESQALAA